MEIKKPVTVRIDADHYDRIAAAAAAGDRSIAHQLRIIFRKFFGVKA